VLQVPHARAPSHRIPSSPAGTPKQLPEGYQGLLLKPCGSQKQGSSSSDTQQRSWQALQSFTHMMVWNHDIVPASSDWHMRCIDFLALADKVRYTTADS
jgi:hypothetical protein